MAGSSRDIESSVDPNGLVNSSEKHAVDEDVQLISRRSSRTNPNRSTDASFVSAEEGALANPLLGLSREEMYARVEKFAHEKGLTDHLDVLRKGALVAQKPWGRSANSFLRSMSCGLIYASCGKILRILTLSLTRTRRLSELNIPRVSHSSSSSPTCLGLILFEEWSQPLTLYSVVACCSMAAAVQGVRGLRLLQMPLPLTGRFARWMKRRACAHLSMPRPHR
jgi:hypothetical protein